MKKIISLIALSTLGLLVLGQSEKHELYITAGIGTVPFIIESFDHMVFFSDEIVRDQTNPVITIGYQYRLSKKIRIGPEVVLDRFWINNRENSYRFKSMLVRFDINWLSSKRVNIYSGVSTGVTSKNAIETIDGIETKRNGTYLGLHLYLFCFDYKLGKFSMTFNKGLGVSGIVNLGMKYRF